ncbi:ankyrin [Choiromyces venosus 120613-1]|uniref:Ankyrin n=1 Tax=Choiromyces venosus 120613-1 TaxID=1336337 RepID=A0A3N4J1H0_9PEZI|nr:ankyrin [Choiromyces venosus 120613-1]
MNRRKSAPQNLSSSSSSCCFWREYGGGRLCACGRGMGAAAWAVNGGDPTMTRSLLDDERVDVNLHSRDGETALRVAVRRVNTIAVDMLLAHPKIEVWEDGITILHRAIFEANRSMIKLLLESKKIDVNSPVRYGITPLILAVFLGKVQIISILLDCENIEVGALNWRGNTARDFALPYHPEIARALSAREILGYKRLDYLDLAIENGLDNSEWRDGMASDEDVNLESEDKEETTRN